MVARRWWQHISLLRLSAVLYVLIAILVGLYRDELAWSALALPRYLRGAIPSPVEHALAERGKHVPAREAIGLLKKSLAIDPTSDASLTLAKIYVEAGDTATAIKHLEAFSAVDRGHLETILLLAKLYRGAGRDLEAEDLLATGVAHFDQMAIAYRPSYDKAVDDRFNEKATLTHARYQRGLHQLIEAQRAAGNEDSN